MRESAEAVPHFLIAMYQHNAQFGRHQSATAVNMDIVTRADVLHVYRYTGILG